MEEENFEIPGLEDLEDEQPKIPEKTEPPAQDPVLINRLASLEDKTNNAITGYQKMQSERDQAAKRYANVAYQLVENGLAEYNKESGEIILKAKQTPTVDPVEAIQTQLSEIQSQISQKRAAINKKYADGEISRDERDEQIEDEIHELSEKKQELLIEKTALKYAPKQEPTKPDITTSDPNATKSSLYRQLADRYPDTTNPNSALFKAMNEVLQKDQSFSLKDVNIGEEDATGKIVKFTGNPEERERLIKEALKIVDQKRTATKDKQHKAAADALGGPEGGTFNRQQKKAALEKDQVSMLVNSGFKSKSLIQDVNKYYNQYLTTNAMIMED